MKKILERIIDRIYSDRINRAVFDKEMAKRKPIYLSHHVKCTGLHKGCMEVQSDNIYKGMLQIGFDRISPGIRGGKKSYLNFIKNGKLIFTGKADLSQGISLNIYQNAVLTIGGGIYVNGYCSIQCKEKITIGKNNMWGWNVELIDGDGHPIYSENGKISNFNKPITIGDNVWLGAHSSVIKGAEIQSGCIVGYGSIVTGKNNTENSVLVGYPAKEVKTNITWSREELYSNQDHQ